MNCLTLHEDVSCSATAGIVFINETKDTVSVKVQRLGDPKQSHIDSIEKIDFKLLPFDTFTDTVKYKFISSDECVIHRIFWSNGLAIEITNPAAGMEQKESYPINDAMNAEYVNLDKLSGIVFDTILIK